MNYEYERKSKKNFELHGFPIYNSWFLKPLVMK
jgi:hypothetical protein